MNSQLEQGPTSDDLEGWEDDPRHVDVRNEDVARDLADVLQEAEVQVLVLKPRELKVAVHVRAVGVPVA